MSAVSQEDEQDDSDLQWTLYNGKASNCQCSNLYMHGVSKCQNSTRSSFDVAFGLKCTVQDTGTHYVCIEPESTEYHSMRDGLLTIKFFAHEVRTWRIFDADKDDPNLYSHYIVLPYNRQCGPQCGFSALNMILTSVGQEYSNDALVLEAVNQGFTMHGEMFSSVNLAKFATEKLFGHFDVQVVRGSLKGREEEFRQHIIKEDLIMVAYDADYNSEPCLAKGQRAHWAVICGFFRSEDEKNFCVIARHGKSRYPGAWNFSALQHSNENLCEIPNKTIASSFKIPAGGVKDGLASQYILFRRAHNIQ